MSSKNSQYGTCWIYKDKTNKKIPKKELKIWVEKGWIKGRLVSNKVKENLKKGNLPDSIEKRKKTLIDRYGTNNPFNVNDKHTKRINAYNKAQELLPFDKLSNANKRSRILKEQNNGCLKCGLSDWLGDKISLELDHIDGNTKNNTRDNLRILCPNCHSQTPTFRRKKN